MADVLQHHAFYYWIPMRYLSLFSGIEAATSAWKQLGWECVAVAEIEPFPCRLLAHHYPHVPNLGDITKITEAQIKALGHIDLVVFGSPCQDLSVAGLRKGFNDGTRSSLFFTAIRLIQWARIHGGCRFALWENVTGAFSSNQGRDFASVVAEMAGLRDVEPPKNGWGSEGCAVGDNGLLEWSVLDAQWFGVAQRRRRIFALADFGDWSNRPPVLLERRSLRGDTPPSREAGEEFTGTIAARTAGGSGLGTDFECAGGLQPIAGTLTTNCRKTDLAGSAADLLLPMTMAHGQGGAEISTNRAPTLTCNHEAPTLTCNHEAPIAVYNVTFCDANGRRADRPNGGLYVTENPTASPTLTTQSDQAVRVVQQVAGEGIAAYSVALRGREGGATAELGDEVAGCLRASSGGGDKAHVLAPVIAFSSKDYGGDASINVSPTIRAGNNDTSHANSGTTPAIAFDCRQDPINSTEVFGALGSSSPQAQAVAMSMAVRRLTPRECERLQGFPDDYTLIPMRTAKDGKVKMSDDGPRYKALGNSKAVPVVLWIGQKIDEALSWSKS